MKKTTLWTILAILSVMLTISPAVAAEASSKGTIKTVAVLPFQTNAQNDISYISAGILSMLHSRLPWKGQVQVVNKGKTAAALEKIAAASGQKSIYQVGEETNADYIVAGMVTEFGGAFSIDTKVYDIGNNSFYTFFGQSETIDEIIAQVDVVTAKINKKVFDRTTVSYEKFKKENIITEEELRRMNPERMMPAGQHFEEEEKPWWKIW